MTGSNFDQQFLGPDPKRLLLAVVAVSLLFMLYSYLFTPQPNPIPAAETTKSTALVPEVKEEVHKDLHKLATPKDIPSKEEEFLITDNKQERISYKAKTTNIGARINQFLLTDFSEPKLLINGEEKDEYLSLKSKNESITLNSDAPYEVVLKNDTGITYRHITKEGLSIERKVSFLKNSKVDEIITLKNLSTVPQKLELALILQKHNLVKESKNWLMPSSDASPNLLYKSNDTYKKISFKDASKESKSITNPTYVGFDDQYFLGTYIPKQKDIISEVKISSKEIDKNNFLGLEEVILKPIVLMPNETKNLEHELFLGPKQVDLLSTFVPSLEDNVEFGWLSVLCRPMLWMLVSINNYVSNFGWAIILLTLLIKLVTYPLTRRSFSSQQEMKKIAPKIKDLQKKYSHDRTLLGQKQMELYREHGINPMAGCLPLLIQLPVWFALYRMLGFSVELYDQPFFAWIHDLTKADPYYILPITMGISMLLTQMLMPPQVDQPEMKYVLWGMPIFFTFIMLNLPAGLSLYILTNNVLTIAQQVYLKRRLDKAL